MRKGWVVLLVAILGVATAYAEDQRYVIATSVNLRELPRIDAKVIAKLSIATGVTIVRLGDSYAPPWTLEAVNRTGWVSVVVQEGEQKGLTGWVDGKFLVNRRPTIESLIEKYDSAPDVDPDTRVMWVVRALALDPSSAEALKRFKDVDLIQQMLAEMRKARPDISHIVYRDHKKIDNRNAVIALYGEAQTNYSRPINKPADASDDDIHRLLSREQIGIFVVDEKAKKVAMTLDVLPSQRRLDFFPHIIEVTTNSAIVSFTSDYGEMARKRYEFDLRSMKPTRAVDLPPTQLDYRPACSAGGTEILSERALAELRQANPQIEEIFNDSFVIACKRRISPEHAVTVIHREGNFEQYGSVFIVDERTNKISLKLDKVMENFEPNILAATPTEAVVDFRSEFSSQVTKRYFFDLTTMQRIRVEASGPACDSKHRNHLCR